MSKKLPYTPRSKIRAALRNLWLRSRERAASLKQTGYRCSECDVKQSKAKGKEQKIEVHHLDPIDWEKLIDLVMIELIHPPERLKPLCPECHTKEHQHEHDQKRKTK